MWRAVMVHNDFGPVDRTPLCERAKSTNAVRKRLRKECLAYMEPRDMKRGKYMVAYAVYFKPEGKMWVKSGTVFGNTMFMGHGSTGVYWVPKDKENTDYNPMEIKSDGSLGKRVW